jgi:hypothetical protein
MPTVLRTLLPITSPEAIAPPRSIRTASAALAVVLVAGSSASAELIAAWNFNAWNPETDFTVAADHGSGLIDLTAVSGALSAFAGTATNAFGGDAAGSALSIVGQAQNGRAIHLSAATGAAERLTLSFACRRTDSGFTDNRVEAWVAGDWVEVGSFAGGADWPVHTFEFDAPTQLFGGVTELRITIGGATSATGNIRFDNLRLESRSVPAPGALALLGLGATVARSRRRR